MRSILLAFSFVLISVLLPVLAHATDYYISPTGSDSNGGVSQNDPWKTFDHVWDNLYPGDAIILMDGVYYQTLNPNKRNGHPDAPITIRAQNDGQAIIDGQFVRTPVKIGDTWIGDPGENPIGNYYTLEGIVAKNGDNDPDSGGKYENNGDVINIHGHHNILRRISAYNASTDGNSAPIKIGGENHLVEDCIAAGTGRKMIYTRGNNNTFRRCIGSWSGHDSKYWHDAWPWGNGIQAYNANFNIFENVISLSALKDGISLLSQGGVVSVGNRIMGSIALRTGINIDDSVRYFGCPIKPEPCDCIDNPNKEGVDVDQWCIDNDKVGIADRPQPTEYVGVADFGWASYRSGFNIKGGSIQKDIEIQDILSWGNADLGLSVSGLIEGSTNNRINRATLISNGRDEFNREKNMDAIKAELDQLDAVTNSYIEHYLLEWIDYNTPNISTLEGEGARLTNRYIDGVLTNQPLWPWPMEERAKEELAIHLNPEHQVYNFSVTCTIGTIINDAYATSKASEGIDMTLRDVNWADDPDNLVVQACNGLPIPTPSPTPTTCRPGDTSRPCDDDIDIFDYNTLLEQFGQPPPHTADFSVPLDGDVDIFDYNTLLSNFGM